ncbi:hypothetical protein CCR75_008429 [Bremia lactucae]|uniref:CASP C-terminal domain-containing protein n=1 Tax=Bremia lactucae TaxID=4779 RepID=A0A976FFL4_BRELC|nr:hypothetical protein CCR75_008429 [Bremia lactucae]
MSQLQNLQNKLSDRDAKIRGQARLICILEESVVALEKAWRNHTLDVTCGELGSDIFLNTMFGQLTATPGPYNLLTATADAKYAAPISIDSKMLEIVRVQRDRFRKRMKELQSEKNRVEELAKSPNSSVARLEMGNMQLYYKIRYLQNYGGNTKSGGSCSNPIFKSLEGGNRGAYDFKARYRGTNRR